ncbi:uncharacterized protein LOC119996421 [Tripterygium wilfordii]|uniref:uncharacterized protein LOC119996421 n=1 Tax=Tripterygium wilfordii TaxID=458696 RepID=UPI0018F8252B|nr:uncharacterized protein LOC119996421 [Tripterygium wilfordii]
MAMKLCIFFMCLLFSTPRSSSSSQWTVQVRNHLKRLNKPPVKSIKSPDGDIIDCVHIYDQPALDHPSLRNHTIEVTTFSMRPSVYPGGPLGYMELEKGSKSFTQLWQLNGRCPQGTIPIRRISKEDILRASSIERFGMKKPNTIPHTSPTDIGPKENGHEYSIAYITGNGAKYYGAKGSLNVWKPIIQEPVEFSLAQTWVVAGPVDIGKLNSIESGWQVYPAQYGDNNPRVFIYWTKMNIRQSDGYQSKGCYNLMCPGFVQVSHEIALGSQILPISEYGGSQFDIQVNIWKDQNQGNWWLQYGNGEPLGYWPGSLFTFLADSATLIEWGGEIVNKQTGGQHTTTQMGSGHFPGEFFHKAAFFRNLKYVDNSNVLRDPQGLATFVKQSPNCYDVKKYRGGPWEYYFYYGGPGRNPNCP